MLHAVLLQNLHVGLTRGRGGGILLRCLLRIASKVSSVSKVLEALSLSNLMQASTTPPTRSLTLSRSPTYSATSAGTVAVSRTIGVCLLGQECSVHSMSIFSLWLMAIMMSLPFSYGIVTLQVAVCEGGCERIDDCVAILDIVYISSLWARAYKHFVV